MDRYMLSPEGKARFKRTRVSVGLEGKDRMGGYEILDYLYEHGAATVAEIGDHTGLSWGQVVEKLGVFIHSGYIEKLPEP